ncbi:high mobility group box domain-containing protein, partial [Mycena galericulata]
PDHIKRPPNAFILFRSSLIEEGIPSCVGGSHCALSAVAGRAWRALSEAERQNWRLRARTEKDEHSIKHPGFVFRPAKRK